MEFMSTQFFLPTQKVRMLRSAAYPNFRISRGIGIQLFINGKHVTVYSRIGVTEKGTNELCKN